MPGASQTRAYVALTAIVALWASYPTVTKLALPDFPPLFLSAVRCTVASVLLATWLLRATPDVLRGLTPAALRAFAVLGVAGITVSTTLSYLAIAFTSASNVVLLGAATPVMVALTARCYLGERLTGRQWLGVAMSATGVLLVITEGQLLRVRPEGFRAGDLINLVGLAGWSVYTVYGTRVLRETSPALATTAAYVLGTLVLLPVAVVAAPLFPPPRLASGIGWGVVLYQALLGAIAHVGWYRAVSTVGPSRAAVFMNLQPVLGVALATVLLDEAVTAWPLIGGALVLGGVALTTRGHPRDG